MCDDESISEDDTPNGVVQFQNKIHKIGLFIPPIPPTDFSNSFLFKIRYYLQASNMCEIDINRSNLAKII